MFINLDYSFQIISHLTQTVFMLNIFKMHDYGKVNTQIQDD